MVSHITAITIKVAGILSEALDANKHMSSNMSFYIRCETENSVWLYVSYGAGIL